MTTPIVTPKPFVDIVAGMIERVRVSSDTLTDFNVGSVIRSVLEACAIELDDYYQELYLGLRRAIPTAIYLGFGFDLRPAVAASGTLVFTRIDDMSLAITIPPGTRFVSQTGESYVTNAALTLPSGAASGQVTASAERVGSAGNTGPGTILPEQSTWAWSQRLTVTNPALFSAGEDAETEEQRSERFAAFILALAHGTPAAMEYRAKLPGITHPTTGVLIERVQRAAVAETPGYVELWIHNGSFGASDALVARVQAEIDGYRAETGWVGGVRPAGMRVDVMVMEDVFVDIALELKAPESQRASVQAGIANALAVWLISLVPGAIIRPIDIIGVALSIPAVSKATILSPLADLAVQPSQVMHLGDLEITWTA